ncbi:MULTISPECIES: alanine racemase [Anaerotruncus]|jgi:D-serine deaminase-like pyridoxal phosphate-dependent protein|uniref:D-threonine aldolase n=1 Tax=Anaerotruncus colihominis TaxID=169435 RepID=A0A845SRW2_9FIRM|nr:MULTISPECIES: alanine racemase [Anaerotruncus]MCI8492748.1 hypothetical protein [Anaerotruncus sp.]MCR2026065.1 alanine racemase [Anaerotruncus colihominis]NDO38455.1 hypothetical protein [Anaerotruncus colihominis]
MNYKELDTPALIIDREKMMDNLHFMQDYANRQGVALRPHTKTHKIPAIARLQEQLGAKGVTVAKVGEAEVMAQQAENLLHHFFKSAMINSTSIFYQADKERRKALLPGPDSARNS